MEAEADRGVDDAELGEPSAGTWDAGIGAMDVSGGVGTASLIIPCGVEAFKSIGLKDLLSVDADDELGSDWSSAILVIYLGDAIDDFVFREHNSNTFKIPAIPSRLSGLQTIVSQSPGRNQQCSVSSTTSSSFNGVRLKGSVGSFIKCALRTDRSMLTLDCGSFTGSFIKVNMSGSRNSSGISPSSNSSSSSSTFTFSACSTKLFSLVLNSTSILPTLLRIWIARLKQAGLKDLESRATASTNSWPLERLMKIEQMCSSRSEGLKWYASGSCTLNSLHLGPTRATRL
ncbi:hypothetical protein OGATHE_001429 [Ogataea polymorpha]|uniref:Uncharacterized protein n=1 Tax=Ogataea polymorpha TaxID=460523 RepID=A0A9P8TFJ4_9ASCO|nr:hypothetical protein OGATHE_001429 [Ogataea polymorpha]